MDGLLLDSSGNLYFCGSFNNWVRRIDAATGLIKMLGDGGLTGE